MARQNKVSFNTYNDTNLLDGYKLGLDEDIEEGFEDPVKLGKLVGSTVNEGLSLGEPLRISVMMDGESDGPSLGLADFFTEGTELGTLLGDEDARKLGLLDGSAF